jgi:hypothetical protein
VFVWMCVETRSRAAIQKSSGKGKPQRKTWTRLLQRFVAQQITLCKIFKKLFFQDLYRSFFEKNLDASLPLLTLDKLHGNLHDVCKALLFLYKWEFTRTTAATLVASNRLDIIFSSELKSCLHFFYVFSLFRR